ncbi:MAG: type secretion system protein [Acidobacteriota bacterium]|jgi:type VI secretion system protein|nr:type secretion system protein [Acidobacteriota bacterium]
MVNPKFVEDKRQMVSSTFSPHRTLILTLGVFALLSLTGSIPGAVGQNRKLVVKVNVSPQANDNNPVAVDLLLVREKKVYKELMKLSASEWFQKRNQYRLDYPKETGLAAGSWEWVPGQVVVLEPISFKYKVAGALVFANYLKPGTHRVVVDPSKPIVITLGPEDIAVKPEK